jgi:hypothetical protein
MKEASERRSNWVGSWPCPQILRPDWKGFSKDKPSSLLGFTISDEGKKFYNIDTWCSDRHSDSGAALGAAEAAISWRHFCSGNAMK